MKKITYQMSLLSSLVVSPRSGLALYTGIDEFLKAPELEEPVPENVDDAGLTSGYDKKQKRQAKVVYPFYQYGEYDTYDPVNTRYYLPGSSVKGALQRKGKEQVRFMADDVAVPNERVVLRNLWKVQHLDDKKEKDEKTLEIQKRKYSRAKYDVFFENVGVEMIRGGTELQGELYFENEADFEALKVSANQNTIKKIQQMLNYLRRLLDDGSYSGFLMQDLGVFERKLTNLEQDKDVILLGGYKGLLHSILLEKKINGSRVKMLKQKNVKQKKLDTRVPDCKSKDAETQGTDGSLFIDFDTKLFHGLAKIKRIQ